MPIGRKDLLMGAGAAALAAGVGPAAMAQAQGQGRVQAKAEEGAAPAQAPGFYRFRLGSRVVTLLHDGTGRRPNPTQGFVRNASPEQVTAALQAELMPTEHLDIVYTLTALETPEGVVLFDTGTGGQLGATAGQAPANLRAAGHDPAQVRMVVMTHFHGDHISGLTDAENRPLFPQATIVVPKAEWDFWMDDGEASRAPEAMRNAFALVRRKFEPYRERIRQIDGAAEVAPGIRALPTPGHTPGHTSYLLTDGGAQAMVLGDITNRPELNLRNPGWHLVFDMDAEQAEATRRRILDRVASDRIRCIGYHFPFPANGYVAKEGEGYRYIPALWRGTLEA